MKPGAEKIITAVVGDVAADGLGNMDTPVVIAKDGDDVQARGERVGAFVLLHLGGLAEIAERGHDRHPGVEARGQRRCVASVEDFGHKSALVECWHERLQIDSVVVGAGPSAFEIAVRSPEGIRRTASLLDERRFWNFQSNAQVTM